MTERLGFLAAQETNAPRRLLEHTNGRHPIEPFPILDALAKYGAHQFQHSVYRCVANPLGELCLDDFFDQRAVDGI